MKKSRQLLGLPLVLLGILIINACVNRPGMETTEQSVSDNELTAQEADEGFFLLFDGESFDGWRGYNKPSFPEKGWVIDNGMLKVEGSGGGEEGGEGGDIIYDRKFKDFHLKYEWMVSTGGNSGVVYLASEVEGQPIWTSGLEMQVLDNQWHIENYDALTPLQMAGSLYDMVAANPQNANPAGEWNTAEIIVKEGVIVHRQNGELVLETEIGSPDWEEKVAGSKFAEYPWFGKYEPGYIGLQDHGNDVWFKNIKLKEF